MGERQIRQHPVVGRVGDDAVDRARGHRTRREGVRGAFGPAGATGRVDEHAHLVGVANRAFGHRLGLADHVPPVSCTGHLGTQLAGQDLDGARDPAGHAGPAVKLADEDDRALCVLKDVAQGLPVDRRVDRYGHVPRHPGRDLKDEVMRTVLRHQRDLGARCVTLALQVGRQPSRLVESAPPGIFIDAAAAQRLDHVDAIWPVRFPAVDRLQRQLCVCDRFQGFSNRLACHSCTPQERRRLAACASTSWMASRPS